MNSSNCTLWMGNIENWMSYSYLHELLKSANIHPKRLTLKNYQTKRGCAFLEFYTREMAEKVLTEWNNKIFNGIQLKFNWVRSLEQKYNCSKITIFTVSKKIFLCLYIFSNSFLLVILINQYHLTK